MFIKRVVLDPATGKGRLELYRILGIQALPPAGDNASNSSVSMVAGAGFDTDSSSLDWEAVELSELKPALALA
jgi:hypothetical protein